jgi:hypothetical protein
VFCEDVQCHLQFCLSYLSCVKATVSSIMETEKSLRGPSQASRVVGNDSHVVFGNKFPGEKESVKWCVVVMQQVVVSLSKFRAKSLHVFMQLL